MKSKKTLIDEARGFKTCSKCKSDKPLDAYTKTNGIHISRCRECHAAYDKEYRRQNLQRIKATKLVYNKRPEVIAHRNEYFATRGKELPSKTKEKRAEYRKRRGDKHREYNRAYSKTEKARAQKRIYSRQYGQENKAIMRDKLRERRQRNPQKANDACIRYKARKFNAPQVEIIDRSAIIARDNSTCYLCDKYLEPKQITLDHVIPLARGGTHTADNLKVACRSCNSQKHKKTPDEFREYLRCQIG